MKFQIPATKESPIMNPAFVIKNFDGNIDNVEVEINDNEVECKKGIETDTDGSEKLVIWLEFFSESNTNIEISSK